MRYKLAVIPIPVFLIILYFLYSGLNKDPTLIPSPLIGKSVPEFSSTTLIDNKIITNQNMLGKSYILNVWGSWCYGCSLEHNFLIDIYNTDTIEIYGLNYKDDRQKALSLLERDGNPFEFSIYDKEGSLAIDLGVYGAPETFLINSDGIIKTRHVGALTPEIWNKKFVIHLK